jgi:addiction module HigA family antidote
MRMRNVSVGDNGMPPIHPGEYVREILDELALTQTTFAEAIGVSPVRVSHLLRGDRPVTAELALRLGRALRQSPQYWLNLQNTYDLKVAKAEMKESLKAVRELIAA